MDIYKKIISWYNDNVMPLAVVHNWITVDFYEAIKVIKSYQDKIEEPQYSELRKFQKKISKKSDGIFYDPKERLEENKESFR